MIFLRARFVLILGLFMIHVCAVRAELVGYWNFDEGSGTTAYDSTANGYDGTLTNMELPGDWVTGHTGLGGDYALDFDSTDGTREYVTMAGFKGVTGTDNRTVSAWIKLSDNTNNVMVSWGADVAGDKWVFRTQDSNGTVGAIRAEVNGGYSVGSTVVTDNTWHHVAATWAYDGSPDVLDVKLYVDGNLEAVSASLDETMDTASNQDVRVGGESFGSGITRQFLGQIDDVAIYNHALTAAEISLLASGASPLEVLPVPTVKYNAGSDVTPTNGTWEDIGGVSTSHDWAINNNTSGARRVTVNDPTFTAITHAYTFNGGTDTATTATFESVPGNPTDNSASFEVLFKPGDTVGQEIILETGGTGYGTSIAIDGNKVLFTTASNSDSTTDQLEYTGLTTDYIHVVGVIDIDGAGADLSLFINGNPVAVDTSTVSGFTDWAGGDNSGLGQVNGTAGGNRLSLLNGFGKFSGEIAIVNLYESVLSGAEVQAIYNQLIPEPATLLLLGIGGIGLMTRRWRK